MIEFTGADILEDLSKEELVEKRESSEEFRKREQALTSILETVADTRIRINGTLTATGVSQIPTVAFAFVRLARIEFEDGSTQLVVSNKNEDIIAADEDGDAVGTSDQESDILCVSGFIC
ncbi:unnamed protein product [Chondrus crispus]|uniref:Uncharacterized protein n=1 Tax=Chondrus crispus TaxID=2769 RepID=R7Q4Y7_CHOCR|nr:unnamed protein product [Chondrus crispus]CDF32928.1 unnamed protein product [Chondrus crispus]|eukprot:XP_005712731.1 unnamed protein product [Chondrus crispus]